MIINGSLTIINFYLGVFLPEIGETLFSTQGIMVMLLIAYGGAMWMFLTSAPKVYTVMVSDLNIAKQFYEQILDLPIADIPLHYYYNYEQSLGASSFDPIYMGSTLNDTMAKPSDGLWYQLKKNTQLHIIGGASLGYKDSQRHVCFDRECLNALLLRVQSRRLKYKIRKENPLNFLVKDYDNRVIEMAEVN
ncbi:glyoxalase-like domain protein [Geminocystis sp. GBBB08]|uniref:glyoxalase-like domain protein n=1 Tax=Geminocystis sp. GBBB08 TaxID=2604140 RepID=UPI0027E3A60D|nr:glyoxalase-like domain protein [Geminocystis sp. GBBB08]MBL1209403.1 glyoxalase-like domain protein [Geminocystis sp. GBBB08]